MLEKVFKLRQAGTDTRTEIIAGITTFMTMAYIIFVNPSILSAAGMDFGAVMTATALAAGITTILMGVFVNYPFALASGMGLNVFFAFVVASAAGWQAALGVVFISGIVFLALAVLGVINWIDAAVPTSLKKAVSVGIGLMIALIGLQNSGIIHANPDTFGALSDFSTPGPILSVIGLIITGVLIALRVRGAILIGILATAVLGVPMGVVSLEGASIFGRPASLAPIFLHMDLRGAMSLGFMTIFAFVFVDVFDTMGTLMGTAARAGMLDERGRLPRVKQAMMVDAVGTMGGAVLGTSTVTTYIESASGIAEGGRTGLTAVVVGVLFLLSLFLSPLAGLIPAEATAPALIIVGILMMAAISGIDFNDITEALPAFVTIVLMPFTLKIADGIAAGFLTYPIMKLAAGRSREVHPLIYVLALVALVHFAPALFGAMGH